MNYCEDKKTRTCPKYLAALRGPKATTRKRLWRVWAPRTSSQPAHQTAVNQSATLLSLHCSVSCTYFLSCTLIGRINCHRAPAIVKSWLGRQPSKHGPLVRYVKLQVVYVAGMPRTFSPAPQVSNDDMHHGMCVTHLPQCKRKTFMAHQTFVWWPLHILYKFVKFPIRHLGLAIGYVRHVRRFSPPLLQWLMHAGIAN